MTANICNLFFTTAGKQPDQAAVIDKNKNSISYGKMAEEVRRTSAYLAGRGIQRGDRVLVFVPMSIDLYRIVLALFHLGAVAVFVDEWASRKRLASCCRLASCKGFIAPGWIRLLALTQPEIRKIPVKLSVKGRGDTDGDMAPVAADESALITFTTGTTGLPKGADRTHGFLMKQFQSLVQVLRPEPGDCDITNLPIVLLLNLGMGKTSVIPDFKASRPAAFKPARVQAQVERYKVNTCTLSPYFMEKLAVHTAEKNRQLTRLFTGGAAVFPQTAESISRAFPAADLCILYGSTEAEPISTVRSAEMLAYHQEHPVEKGLLAGKKHPDILVMIIPAGPSYGRASLISLPANEPGEICVLGPHVLERYIHAPGEQHNLNKIKDGDRLWHRTGDLGYLDENGNLFLLGRVAHTINFRNTTYYPFVIEYLLQQLPGLSEGTMVQHEGQTWLALVKGEEPRKDMLQKSLAKKGLDMPIVWWKNLPRDSRHHSRFDYDKIKKRLPG